MNTRLIILSDLWGIQNSVWEMEYINELSKHFVVNYYDSCQLANIETDGLNETKIHELFVADGINIACANLCKLEPTPVHILAFSIGGTIAWKAGLNGLKIKTLFALSSTRLRYETEQPNGYLKCFFGENDIYRPSSRWSNSLDIVVDILQNETHNLYTTPKYITQITQELIEIINN